MDRNQAFQGGTGGGVCRGRGGWGVVREKENHYPKKSKEGSASRTRSERDTNLHNLRPSRDKTG